MGRIYKTSQGNSVDMDKLKLKNEHVIAVGNMKVNARGDKLGTGGEVEQTRNEVKAEQYKINEQPKDKK